METGIFLITMTLFFATGILTMGTFTLLNLMKKRNELLEEQNKILKQNKE